jgi:hypothetical protein
MANIDLHIKKLIIIIIIRILLFLLKSYNLIVQYLLKLMQKKK